MVTIRWTADARLARRGGAAVRPAHPRPGDDGAALRPGDLRGAQGLPPARRLDRLVPARRERRPVPRARRPGWRWRSCPTSCSSPRSRSCSTSTASGCRRRAARTSLYLRPFMMATEVGLGVRPSAEYLYCADRLAGRAVLPGRREAGRRVAEHRVHARRARRHRHREVRRQLRGLAAARRPRAPSTAARRWSTSTPRSAAGSTRWARTTCSSSTARATRSRS